MNRLISFILLFTIFSTQTFAQQGNVKITVLYDNYQYSENTIADWGYSCLIVSDKDTILFDTGARKDVLFHNFAELDIDLSTIQKLVISHHHGDHVGNIFPLIERCPRLQVFLPSSLNGSFKEMVESYQVHAEIDQDIREIAHNVFLSGEMGFQIREQALVIKTEKGLVLIAACGHPGIDRMVRKVSRKFDDRVIMVMGGFHLEEYSGEEIDDVIATFKECGVEKIVPGHCTGQIAMEKFMKTYKHNFVRSGTGKTIEL